MQASRMETADQFLEKDFTQFKTQFNTQFNTQFKTLQ
jgi:hypothetical protein